ncbi:uncharacterized protein [Engystomops pustulosus]|uniref:uncharacterized protein isoform X2 n=1 Tax=Engystomops pustulosus TaxID=76066 RepID=UPI003AFA89C8
MHAFFNRLFKKTGSKCLVCRLPKGYIIHESPCFPSETAAPKLYHSIFPQHPIYRATIENFCGQRTNAVHHHRLILSSCPPKVDLWISIKPEVERPVTLLRPCDSITGNLNKESVNLCLLNLPEYKRTFCPGYEFTEEYTRKMSQGEWPKIIIVADGSCGESSSLLGVNSEFIVESCNAYGANAALERPDQRQVPTPEIRAHNLYFDLSAYGIDVSSSGKDALSKPGFHLKIYGTFRNRYMALACPASDTKVVRFLRYTPNSSVMRNIFHQSFNAYKTDIEPRMSDLTLPHLQCSRRLFEIVLSHRRVTSAFIEGDNIVVTLEGEAARVLNFDTGCGVNLGLRGLESSEQFIYKIATAVDQSDVFEALAAKIKHSKQVVEEFKLHGLLTSVFE